MEESLEKSKKFGFGAKGIAVVVVAMIGFVLLGRKPIPEKTIVFAPSDNSVINPDDTNISSTIPNPLKIHAKITDTINVVTTPSDKKFVYKNGTYISDGNYISPGGNESIQVTVTIQDDIITEAVAVSLASLPASKNFQGIFISNFKPFIIGKSISDVVLDKVSGSSLTPKGWNDAVIKIQSQAKV